MVKKGLGMSVSVCIPVLNNYFGLEKCLDSIRNVDFIYIIDNGGKLNMETTSTCKVHKPGYNLGVAASWNYFLKYAHGYKIICNDDVIFTEDAIPTMLDAYNEDYLIFPAGGLENINAFSCFLLPNKIVNAIGYFDEAISPNYGYFEDNDYHRRMKFAGFDIKGCGAVVHHEASSTLKGMTRVQQRTHHEKFKLARENYIKKWGGIPGEETYTAPYGKAQ